MGEIKAAQRIIKKLQERLDQLELDYQAVSEQLNYSDNAASRRKLDLQLESIEKQIKDLDQRISKLQQNEASIDFLLQILKPDVDVVITSIQKAYQACCPPGFSEQADTIESILDILQDIPGSHRQFTCLECFVAHLVLDSNMDKSLVEELQNWGKDNIRNFHQLINDIRSDDNSDSQETKSYLLIQVKPKTDKLDRFYICAWLIPNLRDYKPETGDGFKQLCASKISAKIFTLKDIPKIVNLLLEEISFDILGELTIEFFLPYKLLNHAVDSLIRVEFDIPENIGKKYRVVVRANERLQKNYPYKGLWFEKWQKVKQVYNSQCRQRLVSGNHSQEVLRKKLDKAIGMILTQIPVNSSDERIFSFILITATPIVLWLRKDLENPSLDYQLTIDSLLDCCIMELPERVKEHRLDAPQNQDEHIGNHLSLLWEDPERLTPDAGYFYSTPQYMS